MSSEPSSSTRARFPAEYGQRGGAGDEPMAWSEVEELLRATLNYWLTTIGPDGRPHARPVDGVWVDGALCFGGSPETRWVRNLLANPVLSVNLPSDQHAVILEGDAVLVTDPSDPLANATTTASMAKYPQYFPDGERPPFQPFWMLRPRRAYAWSLQGFPKRATRWDFEPR